MYGLNPRDRKKIFDLNQELYFLSSTNQTLREQYGKIELTLGELSDKSVENLYERLFGLLPKKKGMIPTDEELRKSILAFAKTFPERMRDHATYIISSCPKPPEEPQ